MANALPSQPPISNKDFSDLCLILSAARMVFHTRRLHHPDDMPLAMCKTRKGKNLYITIGKIAELPWGAVKRICPGISSEDIKRYSAHSLSVWACILLDEVGKSHDYIKKWLCAWRLFSYVPARHRNHIASARWRIVVPSIPRGHGSHLCLAGGPPRPVNYHDWGYRWSTNARVRGRGMLKMLFQCVILLKPY